MGRWFVAVVMICGLSFHEMQALDGPPLAENQLLDGSKLPQLGAIEQLREAAIFLKEVLDRLTRPGEGDIIEVGDGHWRLNGLNDGHSGGF